MYKKTLIYIPLVGVLCCLSLPSQEFDYEACGSWKRYGNSCYMRVFNMANHAGADASCRRKNAFLVEIDDAQEQRFVFEHFVSVPYTGGVWIGLVRLTDGPEWTWNGGKPLKFKFWGYGEPNDYMNRGEKCSKMREWDGKWNDILCAYYLSYICEKEVEVEQSPIMITDTGRMNLALKGHVIQASNVTGVMDCYAKCQAIPQCLSFNYEHSTNNSFRICELNNSTRGLVGENFVLRNGFTYYD